MTGFRRTIRNTLEWDNVPAHGIELAVVTGMFGISAAD